MREHHHTHMSLQDKSLLQIARNQEHDREGMSNYVKKSYTDLAVLCLNMVCLAQSIPFSNIQQIIRFTPHLPPETPAKKTCTLDWSYGWTHLHKEASTRDCIPKTNWHCLVPQLKILLVSLWGTSVQYTVPTLYTYRRYLPIQRYTCSHHCSLDTQSNNS